MLKASYHIDVAFDEPSARAKIAELLLAFVRRHWETDTDQTGKWADLKPITWATKTTNKMLLESGKMIDSLKIYEQSADRVLVGFGMDYAPYHEYGTANMPMRESLWISNDEIAQLEAAIAEIADDH